VTEERHDELSTADLADRRERDAERADVREGAEPSRTDVREGAEPSRADVREGPGPFRDDLAPGEQTAAAQDGSGPLLPQRDAEAFRARWTDVQTGFVDAPRQAVEQADKLVAELMQHLAKTFADARSGLEHQWDRGDDVPTDDLRTAFQRYRSFFERLLAT
jgi:predicted lipid-binding transport protein (Tim44 family)